MGGIEIAAALLGVINVLLVVRRSVWNYPFGIAMVTLYFFVFWEAKLYSDALLQIFFFLIQLYGWWAWAGADRVDHGVAVDWLGGRARLRWLAGTAIAILVWGMGMARFTDAVAPMADAAVAGLSVSAQILQSLRKVESWILWISVDVLAIGLFAWRGLAVTSALYCMFLVLAVLGLAEWRRKARA
ncbi:MAG TPA: nicotinamide riboside transporter PnuC [Sphingomicrobium sp.]|nr:nicotinamide riboside transporter PnuC [Sphingomicrobium sp.]